MVTINHLTEIQFPWGDFYYMGDFKWIYCHFPVEFCSDTRVCCVVFVFRCLREVREFVRMHVQYVWVFVCVWWQTVEALLLEEWDNVSSEKCFQPSSTITLQLAWSGIAFLASVWYSDSKFYFISIY